MITLNGIRNALWCAVAFGIVACAATPMPADKLAVAQEFGRAGRTGAGGAVRASRAHHRAQQAGRGRVRRRQRDAELAARMADQADVDAQLAEYTARAKQQEQLVTEMDAALRDLREETTRHSGAGATTPQPQTSSPQQ